MRCTPPDPEAFPPEETLFTIRNGSYELGYVPSLRQANLFPPGPVYLKFGIVFTPKKGYGYRHILDRHSRELKIKNEVWSATNFQVIADFCERVCTAGSNIYINKEHAGRLVVSNRYGIVILESRQASFLEHYNVVTAFPPFPAKQAKGTLVGTIAKNLAGVTIL